MMLASLALGAALADVPAIRGDGHTLDVGQAAISASSDGWGRARVGLGVLTQGWSPELQVGWTLPLVEGDWRCDALFAAGLVVPWRAPAAVLTGTAGLRGARQGQRLGWEGSMVAPLALEVAPERALRAPLRAETLVTVQVGPVRLGPRASLGLSWVTGGARTIDPELGLRVEFVSPSP